MSIVKCYYTRYLEGLQKCIGLTAENGRHSPEQVEKLIVLYESLQQEYPSSAAVRRIPLDFLENDDFRRAADSYIRPFLTKGIPSLFSDLRPVYNNPDKSDILEDIFLQMESSLQTSGSFPARCYLKLYDLPPKITVEEEIAIMGLPSSERKKLRKKQRKSEARAKKEAEEKAEEEAASSAAIRSGKRLSQQARAVDIDPNGEKLLQVEDPLIVATKYLKLLKEHSSKSLETYLLAFELYMRKQKILLALQALKRQLNIDADNPDVHRCLIRFFSKVYNLPPPETPSEKLVCRVIETEETFLEVLQGKSLLEVNENFFRRHKDSLLHRAASAEMLYLLAPEKKAEAINIIEDSVNNILPRYGALGVREWKLKDCISVDKLLDTMLKDVDAASRWRVWCAEYFPYSTYFKGQKSSAVSGSINSNICSKAENGDFHKNPSED